MVICIEAGLSLDQAILRTSDELSLSQPEISDELGLVNLEQRAGKARADAWKHMAERTDVDSIRALVALLVQADQFGTSVSKALRTHADTLRTQRRQYARGTGCKNDREAGFSASVLYLSIDLCSGVRSGDPDHCGCV